MAAETKNVRQGNLNVWS